MATVKANRGELFGEWKEIGTYVGYVNGKPEYVVLKLDDDPEREILFTEKEAQALIEEVKNCLAEF